MPNTFRGTLFLLVIMTCAAMVPVWRLLLAPLFTTLGLGFITAVFDNIPLTALALGLGGYDRALLACAAGFVVTKALLGGHPDAGPKTCVKAPSPVAVAVMVSN